jgi:hypothetical protein
MGLEERVSGESLCWDFDGEGLKLWRERRDQIGEGALEEFYEDSEAKLLAGSRY